MTPALLLTNLIARGIEFQAQGNKLRFRPMNLLTEGEVETVRQHKTVILKLLRAEGQQAAEASCGKHNNSDYWVYSPDRYKRSGWQAVQCKLCSTFIGYQPPQQTENEMKCETSIDDRREPDPERPITQLVITNTNNTSNHKEQNMNEDPQTHATSPEKNDVAVPNRESTPPEAAPAAVGRVAAGDLVATEAEPKVTAPKSGVGVVSGTDKEMVLKNISSFSRRLRKLAPGLYEQYSDAISELIHDVENSK